MIDNTYNRLMMLSAEGRRGNIVDSDEKTLTMTTPCLAGSMLLPYVELIYMLPPLRRGGRKGMGKKLNIFFQWSERSFGRIQHMCVRIVQTPMRSKMKCGSTTRRQTVPVLHSMWIAHMTLSTKYVRTKSCLFYLLCHQCITIVGTILMLFTVYPTVCFIHEKWKKHTSIEGNSYLNWG